MLALLGAGRGGGGKLGAKALPQPEPRPPAGATLAGRQIGRVGLAHEPDRGGSSRSAVQPRSPVNPSSLSPIASPCSSIANSHMPLAWLESRILRMLIARRISDSISM